MMLPRPGTRGFSLIELMIALTLGMLAIAAVGNVFLYVSRSYKQDDKISRVQDNLRFAMAQLAVDIEMAGFFAQVSNPVTDITIHSTAKSGFSGTGGCSASWVFEDLRPLDAVGNATAEEAVAKFPCIESARFVAGTDILAIRRVRGACVAIPQNSRYYLRTNGYEHVLYRHSSSPPPPSGTACPVTPSGNTVDVYEYAPAIWHVATDAASGVTSLCRKHMNASAGLQQECLIEGIEDLQVEFGMDSSGNGIADYYTSIKEPTAPQLAQIVAVRAHLLARSAERDVHYVNKKTYTIGNAAVRTPNDGYYRKTLSSIVLVRNAANRISPYSLPE